MLGKVFGVLTLMAFLFAVINGRTDELGTAINNAAPEAVELCIKLLGAMCLWSGVAKVLDKAGFTKVLKKLVLPLLKIIYPESYKKQNGTDECAANISANFLGLGNAALPLGISAMRKFSENSIEKDKKASDDMVMFAVLATTPFQLLPTTLAAMRQASGSSAPFEILLPVWICEIATTVFAIIICKILSKIF